jgi:hypothetical protein
MQKSLRIYIKDKALPRAPWFIQLLIQRARAKILNPTKPNLETIYQRIFDRDLEQSGAHNKFYPLGNSANYGLMYFILRVVRELKPLCILELGAGQSSILFDELRRCGLSNANILTIEHDQAWADYVSTRVRHEVRVVKLKHYDDNGLFYKGYAFGDEIKPKIDFLVVDGPPALTREQKYSRHCSLKLLDQLDPEGFVIVIDDTERGGEALLCERIAERLRSKDIAFMRGRIKAAKQQSIFASGRFSSAVFY